MLPTNSWHVPVGTDQTTVVWDPPPSGGSPSVYICAHGAGGHLGDKSMLGLRDALCTRGLGVVRFNFLYREAGSGRPDPMPRLRSCFEAVIARVNSELRPTTLILGGRSMGGRAASMLVADGFPASGLLLMAYPLHLPAQPDKLRDAHLPSIRMPVLCFNGTRDPFCQPPLMEAVLARLGHNWRMHWLEGADHSFHVLKRSGRTDQEVLAEVADATMAWLP
jgi:uncharacterized protein